MTVVLHAMSGLLKRLGRADSSPPALADSRLGQAPLGSAPLGGPQ